MINIQMFLIWQKVFFIVKYFNLFSFRLEEKQNGRKSKFFKYLHIYKYIFYRDLCKKSFMKFLDALLLFLGSYRLVEEVYITFLENVIHNFEHMSLIQYTHYIFGNLSIDRYLWIYAYLKFLTILLIKGWYQIFKFSII